MAVSVFRHPTARGERRISLALGVAAAVALFVLMALAQMMGDVSPPRAELDETLVAFDAPEIVELEQEEVLPEEEEVLEPELQQEPPQLSLAQLDLALNPGTGGSLVGDFAMPSIAATQADLGTADFVDFSELDELPRPPPGARIDFPSRLKKKPVSGKIFVLVQLAADGEILDVQVASSELPDFDAVVVSEIKSWGRFIPPPTVQGRAVKARARLPIPIQIR